MLINIDNGGTLTDFCVIDGAQVIRTKTVTTPWDLSECLFAGLRQASMEIYGREDVQALLLATDHIRYSTTQGTNALVERKGPRLGLIVGGNLAVGDVESAAGELFSTLVGGRAVALDDASAAFETDAVHAVTRLGSEGANRIVVAFGGRDRDAREAAVKRALLRAFPAQLLGAVPILYAHELALDADDARRTWTALFNAFLHPAMERFLYAADRKLRDGHAQAPLLIFRNDGRAARVARTTAVKTYSSGPRGGAEGARALAAHYGIDRLLSIDIGGTTSDLGLIEGGAIRSHARGRIEGVETSFPLADVVSIGVGGSSILRVVDGRITVGPDSVGSTPGPACFGLGGTEATMTDAFLTMGLLDPASFFGGKLRLDSARAAAAIDTKIAGPLGLDLAAACDAMEAAWVAAAAAGLRGYAEPTPETVLAAFGGAGPLVVCRIAEAAEIRRVLVPKLAAVFSAFGIGFSDIGHRYEMAAGGDEAALSDRASKGMYAEGIDIAECTLDWTRGGELTVLDVVKPLARPPLAGRFGGATEPAMAGMARRVRGAELPVFRIENQPAGAAGHGAAVVEEAYFTCRVDAGWRFEINGAGDMLLTRGEQP